MTRLVGGPRDGIDATVSDHVTAIDVPEDETGMYFKTRPTDTDWRATIDHDWFIHGTPEPVLPDKVFEWHELDWQSPEVRAIRDAVVEASG